jgi:hypothetical protein
LEKEGKNIVEKRMKKVLWKKRMKKIVEKVNKKNW